MGKIKNIIKHICVAGAAGTLLFFVAVAYAQTYPQTSLLHNFNLGAETRSRHMNLQVSERRALVKIRTKQKLDNLEQKISQISDYSKQSAARKIIKQMEHINLVWTNRFIKVSDQLDASLQKIKSRSEKASANGQDISKTTVAIKKAEVAIATARKEAANQVSKIYMADATKIAQIASTKISQNNLVSQFRVQFKALRGILFLDLTSLRDGAVKDARISVNNALQTLSQVPDVDE